MKSTAIPFEAYLAALPPDQKAALESLRMTIKAAAPGAEECISYGLPAFRLNGKPLVAIGATKKHCAFYPMSGSIVETHVAELTDYDTSKGTIRFAAEKPLPTKLVTKLVKARIAEGEASQATKAHREKSTSQKIARKGLTLLELLVVLAIVGMLLTLLFPAIQTARDRARETVCKNNLHQINIAIGDFANVHKRIPGPGSHGVVGGWTIELLPFLEQKNLHDHAQAGTAIASAGQFLLRRPTVFECPVQLSDDAIASDEMDRSHYVLLPSRGRKSCSIYDAPIGFNEPWPSGPEINRHVLEESTGPHHDGFFRAALAQGVAFQGPK